MRSRPDALPGPIEQPGAYQLLFERPDLASLVEQAPGVGLLALLTRPLRSHGHSPRAASDLALAIWAAVHGITSLRIHKPLVPWRHTGPRDVEDVVTALARRC